MMNDANAPALFEALSCLDVHAVGKLLHQGADVHVHNAEGQNLLSALWHRSSPDINLWGLEEFDRLQAIEILLLEAGVSVLNERYDSTTSLVAMLIETAFVYVIEDVKAEAQTERVSRWLKNSDVAGQGAIWGPDAVCAWIEGIEFGVERESPEAEAFGRKIIQMMFAHGVPAHCFDEAAPELPGMDAVWAHRRAEGTTSPEKSDGPARWRRVNRRT